MKRVNLITISFIILFILLVTGCSTAAPQTSAVSSEPPSGIETSTANPEPSADKGVLTGTLVEKSADGADKPYPELRLYLGILLLSDDGKSTLARVDALKAPTAITDADGRFTFTDLEPDRYVLVLQVPPNNLMKLNDPDTGQDMVVDVEAGKITDIGPQYHDLPWFHTATP